MAAGDPNDSSSSPLVTIQQQGVIALNAILQALVTQTASLATLNTTLNAKFPNWAGVPATATSAGTAGQVAYDATHFYVCVATNVWVRCALATF